MIETFSPSNTPEVSKFQNIFKISENTDTIIACIQGIYSSPKITKSLISQGFQNFSCLSGGVAGLSDFFQDEDTISDINYYFPYSFDNSLKRSILEETNNYQADYYKNLVGKKFYIISHKVFTSLEKTITGESLYHLGVKEIKYFREENNLKNFLLDKYNIDL